MDTASSLGILGSISIVVLIVAAVIWPYCRIFGKAGFSPWLGVLMLVPLVNIIMLFYLAFADWPALKR